MAPLSDREKLLAAWRGLTVTGPGEGWQSISLGAAGGLEIRAAKILPEGREAFLVGCPGAAVPGEHSLPQGQGFRSTRLALQGSDAAWFAVLRNDDGSLDLFASMASDVLALLLASTGGTGALLRQVIARVAAWQRFMERGGDSVLDPQEEIGLFGELTVLRSMMAGEVDLAAIVECWKGPLGATHDFRFGFGALEVKTAVLGDRAQAWISSLEQLDTSLVRPLFLVAVRLVRKETGTTLGDMADEALAVSSNDSSARAMLADRLLAVGLRPEDHRRYTRRFGIDSLHVHPVSDRFPRLTRANIPTGVVAARYVIDLDQLNRDPMTVAQARDLLRTA